MIEVLSGLLSTVRAATRSRADLLVEILVLRQQLDVYQRQGTDRNFASETGCSGFGSAGIGRHWPALAGIGRHWPGWREALVIVKPETVLRWHRQGYKAYWRWRSRPRLGRPRIPQRDIAFIRRISGDHPEWGEDRIALELRLKLGVDHSPRTIRRYMLDPVTPPRSSTWGQFIASHAEQIWSVDFTTQPRGNYTVSYVFVVMALGTREIVHVAVTSNPTLNWVKQQLREATPWGQAPRFLMHDNDGIFGQFGRPRPAVDGTAGHCHRCALDAWLERVLGPRGLSIRYGAPNAQAHVERFTKTLKFEALDHFTFFSEEQLRRTSKEFVSYYNEARPHQGIEGIPACGPGGGLPPIMGGDVDQDSIVALPVLGGLHHDYRLAA